MIKQNYRINIQGVFLLVMLAIGLFLRTALLNEVPPGLANDEANIILNAQSFLHTGKNIPGVVTGVLGHPVGNYGGGVHSEISSYLLSSVYAFTGFSLFTTKLPFVFASMGIAVFTYLIAKELLNKSVANIVLILSVINPWLIHFGRSGYESILSALFYLGSIYIFLRTKRWKILFALPFLLLGFLCYFSAKVLLLPLSIALLIFVVLFRPKESLKPVVTLNAFVILFLIVYAVVLQDSASGGRIPELRNTSLATIVDHNRTHSIKFPLETIVENKYIENLNYRINAALGGLSATFLFLNGMPESSGHLSVPDHGPLYPIDLLMVVVGLMYLSRRHTKKAIGLSYLIAITFLPNFINIQNTTYSMRPVILIPILIILVASGIYGLYKSLPSRKFKLAVVGLTVSSYLFFTLRFVFQYYYRMPIENNDSWFFHDRVATHYIQSLLSEDPERKVVWITTNDHFAFYRYIFFSDLYTSTQNIKHINELLKSKVYKVGNVTIQNTCPQNYSTDTSFYLIDPASNCDIPEVVAIIANIDDAGVKYRFVNDPLCQQFVHKRYPLIKNHRLLNIENLTDEDFCVYYISNNQE